MTPQIVMLVIMVLEIGLALGKHGEPRTPHNVGWVVVSMGVLSTVLWWGGFWEPLTR